MTTDLPCLAAATLLASFAGVAGGGRVASSAVVALRAIVPSRPLSAMYGPTAARVER